MALDRLLELRLKSAEITNAKIISIDYVFDDDSKSNFVKDLMTKISDNLVVSKVSSSQGSNNITKLLIPINLNSKHWVGLAVEYDPNKITIYYMASERKQIPRFLKDNLKDGLVELYPGLHIKVIELQVAGQKYNNCGVETIENLIAMCGVPRLPEDEALVIHSLLCEDSLLDHGMGTTSMTMIKKVTYAQLRDDDNSICLVQLKPVFHLY